MRQLRAETARHPKSEMQIAPEQGHVITFLVRLLDARKAIEIGTFTGYSALAIARALPEKGGLIACDVNEEYTSTAEAYWQEAGLADRIDLRIAPASETLQILLDAGEQGSFDFAFIDADKESYDTYYERCLALLRPGGLVMIDNVFRDGRVLDPDAHDESVRAVARLNAKIRSDDRVHVCVLPLADGVTLACKR